MTSETAFGTLMEKIANDFLQTVVVVDDRGLDPVGVVASPDATTNDDGGETLSEDVAAEAVELELKSVPDEPIDAAHALNAKQLIDAFAGLGLVCGVIDPDAGDEEVVVTRTLGAAKTADLLVLDWVLLGQFGDISLEILDRVLEEAAGETKRRLRLVAIYTGEEGLGGIVDKVAKHLEKHYEDCTLERTGDFSLTKGPVRVVVLAKPYAKVAGEDRRVDFPDVPARLIEEFASFSRGIVRAVGLASLAALRRDTHRLLHVLKPELDRGYLADRARLPRPADAEYQLLEIVVGELRSILEDNGVTSIAGLPGLEAWITDEVANSKIGKPIDSHGLGIEQLVLLLRDGLADDSKVKAAQEAGVGLPDGASGRGKASRAFCETKEEALVADARYANRVLSRTHYGRPRRQLDLGTVVAANGTAYMLCMQPQCDATGLRGPIDFPFLPLKRVNEGEAADFVVTPTGQSEIRLSLKRQPSGLQQVTFEPHVDDQMVLADIDGDRHVFTARDGSKLEWVSQLRPKFAQRAAHELGHQFSRVAVDDPESLRLSRR